MNGVIFNFRARPRRHKAIVGPVQFFFTFAFDLGREVNYRTVAQNLLNSGIAETVVSPVDGLVRVSRRYRDISKLKTQLEAVRDASAYIDHERAFKSLSWRAKLVLLKAFVTILAKGQLRLRARSSDDEIDKIDSEIDLDEVAFDIDRGVQSAQIVAALQYAVDRKVLSPSYLAGEPYLRLELKPIRLGQFIPEEMNFGGNDQSDHEVLLLLHKSGIALLTMSVTLPATMPLDAARQFFHAEKFRTTRHAVSEAILRPYGKFYGANERGYKGSWSGELVAGTRWRDFEVKDGTLTDLFELYHTAILQVSHVTTRDESWVCYPTAFIEHLHCCLTRQSWLKHHSNELACFASRTSIGRDFSEAAINEVLGKDASIRSDSTVLIPGGAVTHVSWDFSADDRDTLADWQYLLLMGK